VEPNTWMAIGIMGIAALVADIFIAYYMAVVQGPKRARHLILSDPEYQSVRGAVTNIEAMVEAIEIPTVDVEPLSRKLSDMQKVVENPHLTLTIPPSMEDEVTKTLRDTVRREVRAFMGAEVMEVLSEAIKNAIEEHMAGRSPDEDAEELIQAQTVNYIGARLVEAGLPEPLVLDGLRVARQKGPAVLRALAARFGVEVE
jgi:hypothetical protein